MQFCFMDSRFYNYFISFYLILISPICLAQEVESKAYDLMLEGLLENDVPEVDVEQAFKLLKSKKVVFIDTREKHEYDVSHIKGAIWVGYSDFKIDRLTAVDKNSKIITYCSVGLRSENIALKLIENGYTNVSNLYGSIFEWVNQKKEIVNSEGKPTKEIHPYSVKWGKWLTEGQKAYE